MTIPWHFLSSDAIFFLHWKFLTIENIFFFVFLVKHDKTDKHMNGTLQKRHLAGIKAAFVLFSFPVVLMHVNMFFRKCFYSIFILKNLCELHNFLFYRLHRILKAGMLWFNSHLGFSVWGFLYCECVMSLWLTGTLTRLQQPSDPKQE